MYPNPQDVLPLPPRPDLEQYRRRAKELVKACASGREGVEAWSTRWVTALLALRPGDAAALRDADRPARDLARDLAAFAHERLAPPEGRLAQAHLVIARAHGFSSWTKLVHHIRSLAEADAPEALFEGAADAIVAGDLPALRRLLAHHPELVRARSTRDHDATLLHYVAANGVENYRQKTPANAVDVARLLLDAGAEVDAAADVYGGGATALGLAATSAHPRAMGVQLDLVDLLLERGAELPPTIVRDALANGCPEAAAHLADRGATVGLVDAAGLGRLDSLAGLTADAPPAPAEAARALIMAAWYDRGGALELLLDRGVDPGSRDDDGRTPLHVAAYQGHAGLVGRLLARGAPVDATDDVYGTTPLVWALHGGWIEGPAGREAGRATVRALVEGGAGVDPGWIDVEGLRADPELVALLAGARPR